MKKTTYESHETIVDRETGEITEERHLTKVKVPNEPDYIKLYLKDLAVLNDLPKSAGGILMEVLRYMDYDNEIILVKAKKLKIAERMGKELNTIDKGIQALANKGIIIRKGSGVYEANPYLFGRGKWEDIKKLRVTITYDEKGKRFIKTERILELFD